jgi:hypothetical protein
MPKFAPINSLKQFEPPQKLFTPRVDNLRELFWAAFIYKNGNGVGYV